eukprot:scaffold190242_cov38-Prasinocladus_malaysianus.AAC.1
MIALTMVLCQANLSGSIDFAVTLAGNHIQGSPWTTTGVAGALSLEHSDISLSATVLQPNQ